MQVSLLSWRSPSGRLASAFLSRAAIVSSVALPEAPVRTSMGLGRVKFVREDGVVVVAAGGEGGSKETSSGDSARWGRDGRLYRLAGWPLGRLQLCRDGGGV